MSETSLKQVEANKQNAQASTGPKTEEGKAVSKYNALKHGLLSKEVLFDGEDERELIELGKKLRSELAPDTEFELLLADRIVANFWRLKRAMTKEQASVYNDLAGIIELEADVFFRYETMLEKSIYKALHELQRLQASRTGERPPLPVAIDVEISRD